MEQQKNACDEINLYDLWIILLKRKKLIIGLFLFGAITATLIGLSRPEIYRGDAVLRIPAFEIASSNVTARELVEFIGKIDPETKTKLLPKTHALIMDIKLNALANAKDKIGVVIEAKNRDIIPQSLLEVMEYMNSIEIMKVMVKEEQDKLLKRSSELSSVIAASSDLIRTYSDLLESGKLVPVGFNPVELYKRISEIKIEKQLTEQSLQRLNGGVGIAKNLAINNKPSRPKFKLYVVVSGALSLFIGIIIAFIMHQIAKIAGEKGV